jgi:hypothetical protein
VLGGTNPLRKKQTMSMLSVESGPAALFLLLMIVGSYTATVVALFLDHNRKNNFCHPL